MTRGLPAMPTNLTEQAFAAQLLAGVAELGLTLNPAQIAQFFFTFRN